MTEIHNRATTFFIKDEKTFTSVSKVPVKGKYCVFTTCPISAKTADEIEIASNHTVIVHDINLDKGFIIMKLSHPKIPFTIISNTIKTVLYGTR